MKETCSNCANQFHCEEHGLPSYYNYQKQNCNDFEPIDTDDYDDEE